MPSCQLQVTFKLTSIWWLRCPTIYILVKVLENCLIHLLIFNTVCVCFFILFFFSNKRDSPDISSSQSDTYQALIETHIAGHGTWYLIHIWIYTYTGVGMENIKFRGRKSETQNGILKTISYGYALRMEKYEKYWTFFWLVVLRGSTAQRNVSHSQHISLFVVFTIDVSW